MPLIKLKDSIPEGFFWTVEPKECIINDGKITIISETGSDLWQRTYYGFRNNNGHCLCTDRIGDFVLTSRVTYEPRNQFDQAGLIIYFTEDFWIKCSVEHEPDTPFNLGSVVTNQGYSDWAVQPFSKKIVDVEFKIKHVKNDFEIYYREWQTENWNMLRICHLYLPIGETLHIGIYACSPKEGGFEAVFENIEINPFIVCFNKEIILTQSLSVP